jgi:tetratricopeptide (TPR) repeat protein
MKLIFAFLLSCLIFCNSPIVWAATTSPSGNTEKSVNELIEVLTGRIALNPEKAKLYNERADAYSLLRTWDLALADYQKAIDLDPNFQIALINKSLVLFELGNSENALKSLREIVRNYPMLADARAALTAILWNCGYQGEAESNWVSAIGIDQRYGDIDWVVNTRRWPPKLAAALDQFINLN